MKIKFTLLMFCLTMLVNLGHAQKKKDEAQSIIVDGVAIKKYHTISELEGMQKGELLALYTERIESLVKVLPYIAFATKPGVTMSTLGIPNNNDNKKALEEQHEASDNFLETTSEFHDIILPYSDTSKLISAILFYEEIFKLLHEYGDFN